MGVMSADSFKVTQNTDGTFTIEWDEKDPKYEFLNHLTEDQIKDIIMKNVEFYLNQNKGE
jgi:hypothetical protein